MCGVYCQVLPSGGEVGRYLPETGSSSEQLPQTLESHTSPTSHIFNVFSVLGTKYVLNSVYPVGVRLKGR